MYIYIFLEFRKHNGVTEEDTRGLVDFQHDGIQYFSLFQLEKATDNFRLQNKIGEGGFGVVYLVFKPIFFSPAFSWNKNNKLVYFSRLLSS